MNDGEDEMVITGSPEHQARCPHKLRDGFSNTCLSCGHQCGPDVLEQLAELRARVERLEEGA